MKYKLVNENFRDEYVANLLRVRGVEDVESYMNPHDAMIQDPSVLDNIDAGAQLLYETISKNDNIIIVTDPDCDGFTSAAIMYQYIKNITPNINIEYYVHEHKSHGLEDLIELLVDTIEPHTLVICPDSSTNDYIYHKELEELGIGINVLVLDHHEKEENVPINESNTIVINNQLGDYKNKALTGAGVVYQFCRYYDNKYGYNYADDYVDLAALGIIGDMGSVIQPENRYIITKGLNNIKNFFFLAAINKQSYSMGGKINPISVSFYISPLINAMTRAGNLDEKRRMFEAFIDGEKMIPCNKRGAKGTLEMAAIESLRECTNAKKRQNDIKIQVTESLEGKIYSEDLLSNKILLVILDDDDVFPSELNGLVAMELVQRYNKPVLLGRLNNEGYVRGSIRGLNDSDLTSLKDLLEDSKCFEYVQGHANAAGYSIPYKNIEKFHDYANKELEHINFEENVYTINFIREADAIDMSDLVLDIGAHQGWGQSNSEPLILIKNIYVTPDNITLMKKDTVKITTPNMVYIKFNSKDFYDEVVAANGTYLDIIGRANLNEYYGRITPQIMITDYELKNEDDSYLSF